MARRFLRPIHVLQSGIARLGQGEEDVRLDLPDEDFKDLGTSFNALSQSVSTIRSRLVEQARRAESVVERLEDAVAIVGPDGHVAFANAAMKALLPALEPGAALASAVPESHPCRVLVEQALAVRASRGPLIADLPAAAGEARSQQQLMAHPIADPARGFVGVMLVARNVGALSQLQTMLRYSRKLASLNRLLAGVAHEVKNPLNAMTIHLELLRQKLGRRATVAVAAAAGAGGGRRACAAASSRRPHEPRVDHRRGDPPARSRRPGVPAVQSSRGTAAGARAACPHCCRTSSMSSARRPSSRGSPSKWRRTTAWRSRSIAPWCGRRC